MRINHEVLTYHVGLDDDIALGDDFEVGEGSLELELGPLANQIDVVAVTHHKHLLHQF